MAKLSILVILFLVTIDGLIPAFAEDGLLLGRKLNSKMPLISISPIKESQESETKNKDNEKLKTKNNEVEELNVKKEELEELEFKVNEIFKKYEDLKTEFSRRFDIIENRNKNLRTFLRSVLNQDGVQSRANGPNHRVHGANKVTQSPRRQFNQAEPKMTYVIKRGSQEPVYIEGNNVQVDGDDLNQPRNKRHDGTSGPNMVNMQNNNERIMPSLVNKQNNNERKVQNLVNKQNNNENTVPKFANKQNRNKMKVPNLVNKQSENERTVAQKVQLLQSAAFNKIVAVDSTTNDDIENNKDLQPKRTNPDVRRTIKKYTMADLFRGLLSPLRPLWSYLG